MEKIGSVHGSGEDMVQRSLENQIIVIPRDTRFDNIESRINTPAYVRRKVKFVGDSRRSKVKLKEDVPKKPPQDEGSGSLFG